MLTFTEAVNGIPLIVLMLGWVEVAKRLGIKDRASVLTTLLLGLLLGIGYQYSLANLTTFAGWFGAVLYGFSLGLSACGVFDVITNRQARKNAEALQRGGMVPPRSNR